MNSNRCKGDNWTSSAVMWDSATSKVSVCVLLLILCQHVLDQAPHDAEHEPLNSVRQVPAGTVTPVELDSAVERGRFDQAVSQATRRGRLDQVLPEQGVRPRGGTTSDQSVDQPDTEGLDMV